MERTTKVLAALTIGQAPRTDIMGDIAALLPPHVEVREYGALDDLTLEQIEAAVTFEEGDEVLVSRMRDGRQAHLTQRFVNPLVQAKIKQAEAEGADAVALFCTGVFPPLEHERLFLEPQPLLHAVVRALAGGRRVGVLVPMPDQVEQAYEFWGASGVDVFVASASPYLDFAEVERAGLQFAGRDLAFLVCDCMGFSAAMRQALQRTSGLPVVLPRTLAARVLCELLA
jgi:protein AroM